MLIAVVLGFTVLFVAMGALAGSLGRLLIQYQTAVNIIGGAIVVLFGLNYMGVLQLNLFGGMKGSVDTRNMSFFSAMTFGVIFSIGWTPCVGAFLGSALMLASQQGSALVGMGMLLCYSLGLGVPFLMSAVLIDKMKSAFDLIKRNYDTVNRVCGGFLILIGVAMMTGWMGRLLAILS
jgi:cytochrome c-type biogenesis protein